MTEKIRKKKVKKPKVDRNPKHFPKTDDELKEIAKGILDGDIFTDRHCHNPHEIMMVFLPLALLNEKQSNEMVALNPGLIYEYTGSRNRASKGINGLPQFISMRYLTQEETKVMDGFYEEMEAIKKKAEKEMKEL